VLAVILTWHSKRIRIPDDVGSVPIEYIATALAQINRWGGRMAVPYNVARHSLDTVRLARLAGESRQIQYECLMHDASEAFVGDVVAPVKAELPAFKALEQQVRGQLAPVFGFSTFEPRIVHAYDLEARAHEYAYLCSGRARDELWRESRDRFLAAYMRLAPADAPR